MKSLPDFAVDSLLFSSNYLLLLSLRSLVVFKKFEEKRESRNKERQSREESGRETTEKLPARMAGIFC